MRALILIICAALVWAIQPVSAADVSFSPNPESVDVGVVFSLDVVGVDFSSIVDGGGISISFDPAVVNVLSVSIDPSIWNFVNSTGQIDNVVGTVSDILVSAFPGVGSGNFVVATIEFEATGSGTTELALTESALNPFANDGQLINPAFLNGFVSVRAAIQPDGDINNDTRVDMLDLLLAMRILNGQYTPTQDEQDRWDVAPLVGGIPQPDAQNNLGDYVVLKRKIVGSISF